MCVFWFLAIFAVYISPSAQRLVDFLGLSLSYDREIESIIENSRKKKEQKPQKPLEHTMILNLK